MISKSNSSFKKLLKERTILVAEIGQAHEGSLNIAHSMIDACADAKVDVVKFQSHYAKYESTLEEPFRVNFSFKDKKRYDYWKRMEFTSEEWQGLFNHARKRGLLFMSSVFSNKAFRIINKLDVCAWKIASGEIENMGLLDEMIKTKKTIIVSTGMSNNADIKNINKYLLKKKANFIILQCKSMYPTKIENIGFNVIDEIKQKYNCKVGLSDHSGSIYPLVYGLSKELNLLEFHVTYHEKMFGPDNSSSINFEKLEQLTKFRDAFDKLKKNKIDKDKMSKKLKKTKKIFGKSLCLIEPQKKNYIIKKNDLILKKPGGGIQQKDISKVVGKRLKKNCSNLNILKLSDIY